MNHYLAQNHEIPVPEPWAQRVIERRIAVHENRRRDGSRQRESAWRRTGCEIARHSVLRGKDGPLGIIAIGSAHDTKFQHDEIDYLENIANLLGLDAAKRSAL